MLKVPGRLSHQTNTDATNLNHATLLAGVTRVIKQYLLPGGVAYLVLPVPDNRFGVEHLPRCLKEASLVLTLNL